MGSLSARCRALRWARDAYSQILASRLIMKNTIITIVSVAIAASAFMFAYEQRSQSPSLGELNRFTSVTNTAVACGTSDAVVLATSTGRQYVAITNTSATPVYLALGAAAVGSRGIYLGASGGAFEINQDNLFTGAIHCIASSTAIVGVISK